MTPTAGGRRGAAARLRGAGLRATRARVRLLEWLDEHPGHAAAEDLVEQAGLPKATVYHALGQLRDAGLLLTADSGGGRVLYETADESHHHFVCRRCDRVLDVPGALIPPPPKDALPGVTIDQVDVVLRGRCGRCD